MILETQMKSPYFYICCSKLTRLRYSFHIYRLRIKR